MDGATSTAAGHKDPSSAASHKGPAQCQVQVNGGGAHHRPNAAAATPVIAAAAPTGGQTVTQMYSSTSFSTASRQEQSHRHEVHHTTTVQGGPPPPPPPPPGPAPTPTPRRGPSRFNFKCDTRAPSELKRMQDDALRRREEFQARVAETERRIAAWTAGLANEAVDRDLAHDALTERALSVPLEEAMARVVDRLEGRLARPALSGEEEEEGTTASEDKKDDDDEEKRATATATAAPPPLPELERRAADLDSALLRHSHRTTYDARVRHLDSVGVAVREEVEPALHLEVAKADKREGALVRTYESIAADVARQYAEENATRVSELELLKEEVDARTAVHDGRVERFLGEVRALRQMLEEEREERQKADERILETIVQTRTAWQRIVLESLGEV